MVQLALVGPPGLVVRLGLLEPLVAQVLVVPPALVGLPVLVVLQVRVELLDLVGPQGLVGLLG